MNSILNQDYFSCADNSLIIWGDLLPQVPENPIIYDSSPFVCGMNPTLMGMYFSPFELSPTKSEFGYIGEYMDPSYSYSNDLNSWSALTNLQPTFPDFHPSYPQLLDGFHTPPVVLSNDDVQSLSSKPNFELNQDPNCSQSGCRTKGKKNRLPLIFECEVCNKLFDRKYVLKRHRGTHALTRAYNCIPCKMSFYRKDIFDRHLTTKKCVKAHRIVYGSTYSTNLQPLKPNCKSGTVKQKLKSI